MKHFLAISFWSLGWCFFFANDTIAQHQYQLKIQLVDKAILVSQESCETPPAAFFDSLRLYDAIDFSASNNPCNLSPLAKSTLREKIRSLNLERCVLPDDWADSVAAFRKLEALYVEYCCSRPLDLKDASKLYSLPQLQSLMLKGMVLSNEFVDPELPLNPKLRFLNFLGCSFTSSQIESFESAHPEVRITAFWATMGGGENQKSLEHSARSDSGLDKDEASNAVAKEVASGLGGIGGPSPPTATLFIADNKVRIYQHPGKPLEDSFFECLRDFDAIEYVAEDCSVSLSWIWAPTVRNKLTAIVLKDCSLDLDWLEGVLSIESLKSLKIEGLSGIDDAAVRSLLGHRSLQRLELNDGGSKEYHCFAEDILVGKSLRTLVFFGQTSGDSLSEFQSKHPDVQIISRPQLRD